MSIDKLKGGTVFFHERTLDKYLLCNAFEWDTVEYATRHLYFPYTYELLGECVKRRKYK